MTAAPAPTDLAARPDWAAIGAEPADGWRFYRQNVLRARGALVAGMKSDGMTFSAVQFLTRWVMPPRSLAELLEYLAGYRPSWAGRAEGVRDGDYWRGATDAEFDAGESRALSVVPVWEIGAMTITAIDLIAWAPARPDVWAAASGLADFLGEDRLHDAAMAGGDLRIYATPADWVAGDARWPGVCVLQDGRDRGRDLWRRFEGISGLVCDDEDHAAAVMKETRRPVKRALPAVKFEKSGTGAAA